jgi:hypothetical protein
MAYSTIIKPNTNFNTLTYTGDGVSPRSITGVGFQPDFVWYKNRTNAISHGLQDVIRGVTSTNVLSSDNNPAEPSFTNIGYLSSFNSDGFTATETNSNLNVINASGSNYVAWNWKAGGTAVSNTDGTITSSVSANTTSGFSIVTFTGTGANATVGHGLGSVPKMIIIKGYSNAPNWQVYHASYGNTGGGQLNLTNAFSGDGMFQNTTPTNSVFSLGTSGNVNGAGQTMVAYCFADVKGFSKMGSYVGNGNADGTFVYTGFKPSFIIWKNSSASTQWVLLDNKRLGYNPSNYSLFPNNTDRDADGSAISADLLSNGFKLRTTSEHDNQSGSTFIYMAFAENPLVANTSGGIPTTAR